MDTLLLIIHVYLCYAVLSVPCSLVIICWERADLLALLCVVFLSLYHMFSRSGIVLDNIDS